MSEPDLIPDGDIFGDDAPPRRPRTEAEQTAAAEFEARHNHHRKWRDQEYRRLRQRGAASSDDRQHGADHRERDVRATDVARKVEERLRRATGGHPRLRG